MKGEFDTNGGYIMKYYLVALFVIILDQVTKYIVATQMKIHHSVEVIPGFFYFTSHRNSGAAWGMLQGQMWLFYIVTVVVVIVIIYYMTIYKHQYPLLNIGLALILGGAIGNFIDRVRIQEVIDFLDFNIFGYDFPIFNVADSALTIGVILVIILIIYDEFKNKGKKKHA